MSNPSQDQQFLGTNNNNELDHKNNNGIDLNELKLIIKQDDQIVNDNQLYQVHQQSQSRSNSLTNNQQAIISQSNSQLNSSALGNTEITFSKPINTESNLNNNNFNDDGQTSPQSLPPNYFDIPGTVPIAAGSSNAPPPSYDEVINPHIGPPSYHSLFGQVQAARKNAKTLPDLIRKLIIILIGTIGLAILISFTLLIPTTMILVGGSNLDNCPAEKGIPIFLLFGGIFWLVKNLSNFFTQCSSRRSSTTNNRSTNNSNNNSSQSNPCASRYSTNTCSANTNSCSSNANRSSRCVINLDNEQANSDSQQQNKNKRRDFLINCFVVGWFLYGCCMVYHIYPPNYTDSTSPMFCNRTVYLYAFYLLSSTFIMFALFISCICCISISAIFSSNSEIRI